VITRRVTTDPKYRSDSVAKFIAAVMERGKKSTAERIVYGALRVLEEKTGQPGLNVYRQALTNARPVLEVKSRRVGGATYQVPVEVRAERRDSLARRWLVQAARARGEKTMQERLANELLAAARGEGTAVRRKEEMHRMAEANKAFAHYRW
jgi:small subunit ribosomal protein S7